MKLTRQWGVRVKPDKRGLTLNALNVGVYGEIPDYWDDETRMPRGAYPGKALAPLGYFLRHKYELWADNAADLYEEANQRRWVPATDVPWDTIEPLPDDIEIAMCQFCTELCQQANVEIETISSWLQNMSFGFHEVKVYLTTETLDATKHFEAFRKRALANGGGLGLESRNDLGRVILESKGGWSETVVFLHLLRGPFTMTLYRYGEMLAHNPAEKVIFSRCMQDKARHLAYGLMHLRYAIANRPGKAEIFGDILDQSEGVLVRELKDPVLPEALAVLLGGGVDQVQSGIQRTGRLMGDFVQHYLQCTDWLGIPRGNRLHKGLARYLES